MHKIFYLFMAFGCFSCEKPDMVNTNIDTVFDVKLVNNEGRNYLDSNDESIKIEDISFVYEVDSEIRYASTPSFSFNSDRLTLSMYPMFIKDSGKYTSFLKIKGFPQDTIEYEIFVRSNSESINKVWVNNKLKWDRKIEGDNNRLVTIVK